MSSGSSEDGWTSIEPIEPIEPVEAEDVHIVPKSALTLVFEYLKDHSTELIRFLQKGKIYKLSALIVLLLSWALYFLLINYTESVLSKIINFELINLKLDNSSTHDLLNIKIDAISRINFSILNHWEYLIFYPILNFIGSSLVKFNKPVELILKFPHSRQSHPLNLRLDQFLFNLNSNTEISEVISIEILPIGIKSLIENYNNNFDIILKTSIDLDNSLLKDIDIAIENSYNFDAIDHRIKYNEFNGSIQNFTIETNFNKFNIELPKLEWDIIIPGCDKEFVKIGSLISYESNNLIDINNSLILSKLNNNSIKFCNDGLSPINRFINNIMKTGDSVKVIPKFKSSTNENLPYLLIWSISNIFKNFEFDIKLPIENYFDNDFISDFIIENKELSLATNELPNFNSKLEFNLDLPIDNTNNEIFNIDQITGYLTIQFEDSPIIGINLYKWHEVITNGNNFKINLDNTKIYVFNEDKIVEMIENYHDIGDKIIIINSRIDVSVKSMIFDTILQQLENHFILSLNSIFDFNFDFLVEIKKLIYLNSSNEKELNMFSYIKIYNPFDFNINFDFLKFEIFYKESQFGCIEFQQIYLTKDEISDEIRIYLKLNNNLNELINLYLDGKESNILIKTNSNSTNFKEINKLINNKEIEIPIKDIINYKLINKINIYSNENQIEFKMFNLFQDDIIKIKFKKINIKFKDIEINLNDIKIELNSDYSISERIELDKNFRNILNEFNGIELKSKVFFLVDIEIGDFKLVDLQFVQDLYTEVF